MISRWRLSNHNLRIETGCYENISNRDDRVYKLCGVREDEHHVIFICPAYNELRRSYRTLFGTTNVGSFLDPKSESANDTAGFLLGVEGVRKKLDLTV